MVSISFLAVGEHDFWALEAALYEPEVVTHRPGKEETLSSRRTLLRGGAAVFPFIFS